MNHGLKKEKPLRTLTNDIGHFSKRSIQLVAGAGFEPTTFARPCRPATKVSPSG